MDKTTDEDFWNCLENEKDEHLNKDNIPEDSKNKTDQSMPNKTEVLKTLEIIEARKQKLAAQVDASVRKARNHRFYKLGEVVEKTLRRSTTNDDIEKLELFLLEQEKEDNRFSKSMDRDLNIE